MGTPRRRFLVGIGAATSLALAGCVSNESNLNSGDGNGGDTTDGSAGTTQGTIPGPGANGDAGAGVLLDRSQTIKEGSYIAKNFTIGSETRFNYQLTVENDVPVDLFAIKYTGFEKYKKDQLIEPPVLVPQISNGRGEFSVLQGNYYVVVDHTDRLKAKPPGKFESVPAEVDIKVTY